MMSIKSAARIVVSAISDCGLERVCLMVMMGVLLLLLLPIAILIEGGSSGRGRRGSSHHRGRLIIRMGR